MRDLPMKIGRNPDFGNPTVRSRRLAMQSLRLGRAEACVGGLGAFISLGRSALVSSCAGFEALAFTRLPPTVGSTRF
jgi:hypothetical protein